MLNRRSDIRGIFVVTGVGVKGAAKAVKELNLVGKVKIICFDFNKEIKLDESTTFKFIHSGHLVNSSSLILKLKKGQLFKTVYYTSDLGNIRYKSYYTEPLDRIKSADIVISECTYGNKERSCANKDQRDKDIERLKNVISQYCVKQNGKVLIPVFSLHRGQQMATILYEMYHNDNNFNIPIYMDSILLSEITKIFKQIFPEFNKVVEWDKIKIIDKNTRKVLMETNKPMIILSSSGMVTNGASIVWLRSMITNSHNCVVFVGYCDEGTIGYKLKLKDQKTITIQGQQYKNKIQVCKLKSFSGHMQYQDLLEYLSEINCQTVLLHHGNTEDRLSFKSDLEKEYAKKCKTTQVKVVNKSTVIHI